MFLEYISNMYVLSVIATVIGLCILYMYDKFEKKQYTNAIYMRIGILIFMSCLGTIYISRMNFFQNNTNSMSGGGSSSSGGGSTGRGNIAISSMTREQVVEELRHVVNVTMATISKTDALPNLKLLLE